MRRVTIPIATDASEAATVYSAPVTGLIRGFFLDTGTMTTPTLVITDNETSAAILTITSAAADGWYAPVVPTYGTDGTAALYAAGGTAVLSPLPIEGTVKVVVSSGGATKAGTLYLYVG